MDKAPSPKQRMACRAALIVVAPLLLLSGYVSAWLCVSKAADKGLIDSKALTRIRPTFQPILAYSQADYLGAAALRELWWHVNPMLHPNEFGHGTVFRPTSAICLAPPERGGVFIPPRFIYGPTAK